VTAISLQLTARQWATIDAVMDNMSHNARDSFEDPEPAHAIREAGWQQVPWVGIDRQWPPMEQVITISLRRDQWQLALDGIAADEPIYEDLGDLESLRLGRDAREAIIRQLPDRSN
jgi:hypothetical protein